MRARNDLHGIDVFPTIENLRFIRVSATAQVGLYPPALATSFAREYSKGRRATAKQVLACEIYASSFFDISQRSRFITLVSAVEALLELPKRCDTVQALVDNLEAKTKESIIDPATKASILGSLRWLRCESIRQTGRALAESLLNGNTYAGKSGDVFWCLSYDFRSKIVHSGTAGQSVDISAVASNMEQFVADLLLASLNASGSNALGSASSGA
jgi:hypothetical protein